MRRVNMNIGFSDVIQVEVRGDRTNGAHHPPQIAFSSYRSTFGGRCAWALLEFTVVIASPFLGLIKQTMQEA